MSTDIVTFNFNTNQIRIAMINGDPWFVLADLCTELDISNVGNVADRVDPLNIRRAEVENARGQMRKTLVVNEAGMYEVVLRSDKPEAVTFRRWITGTVLPRIRATGTYSTNASSAPAPLSLKEQAAILRTLRSCLQPDYAEAKARLLAAQAMGEEPEIDPARRPLDVQGYLESRGVAKAILKSRRSTFGTAVANLYRAHYSEEPKKVDRMINGALKEVKGYTEKHRHLFDAAFANDRVLSTLNNNELELGEI